MTTKLDESTRLRSDFRKYLVKIASNKNCPELSEEEILKAFDLAVQKGKLTSLENELVIKNAQYKTSKIDISGCGELTEKEIVSRINTCISALEIMASFNEEPVLDINGILSFKHFDEPSSASLSRKTLEAIKWTRLPGNTLE